MKEAQAFVARHGLTFPMLWDQGFESWQSFGITSQPSLVLVDAEGKELTRYRGEITEAEKAEVARLVKGA